MCPGSLTICSEPVAPAVGVDPGYPCAPNPSRPRIRGLARNTPKTKLSKIILSLGWPFYSVQVKTFSSTHPTNCNAPVFCRESAGERLNSPNPTTVGHTERVVSTRSERSVSMLQELLDEISNDLSVQHAQSDGKSEGLGEFRPPNV
jgi:hypothetical protein